MKPMFVLFLSVILAATGHAQVGPGRPSPSAAPELPVTGVPRFVLAAKGAADKAGKKEEPPAKIEGMEIARGAKGFLGLQVASGTFKLSFYDEKKKPAKPDVVRATLRWNPSYRPNPEFFVLESGDGKTLSSPKTVRPPYNFKLFMSLFVEGKEDPVESFVVDFRQ